MTFDTVDVNGLSPSFKDTAEALAAQTVKLGARRVEAGPFDTKIEGNNYIAVRTKDVRRFSLLAASIDGRLCEACTNFREWKPE